MEMHELLLQMRGAVCLVRIPSLGMPPPCSCRGTPLWGHLLNTLPIQITFSLTSSSLVYAPLPFVFFKIHPPSPLVAVKVKKRVSASLSVVSPGF